MSHYAQDRRDLAERIEKIRSALDAAIAVEGNVRFRERWPAWEARLAQIAEEGEVRPEVPVALLGPTGAGKSTLINALLDAQLLPVNVAKTCTASVTEVAYAEGPTYEVMIEFVTAEEWHREFETLAGELADAEDPPDPEAPPEGQGLGELSKAARDKLIAVYRPENPAGLRLADLPKLRLPAAVTRAFAVGSEAMTFDDPRRLAGNVADFLSSDGRLWPIVRRVKIRGPFPPLEGGATLVDLPGLNDPNEARERVTKDYLKHARYVWIVFGIKRGVTRELKEYLLHPEDNILRQLVMDGRADALTLIATASDDLGDIDVAISQYGLAPDATEADAILARNRDVKGLSRQALAAMAHELGRRAGLTEGEARLADQLADPAVFTISARDYLRLRKLSRGRPALDGAEQTEVPALRRYLTEMGARYGVEAQFRRLHGRLDALLAEVSQLHDSESVRLDGQSETDAPQRRQIEGALDRARSFLGPTLRGLRERLVQDLESNQEVLASRLTLAFSRGREQLDSYLEGLVRYHWKQVLAMARRDGVYPGLGGTGEGKFDFSQDVARPILDSIAIPWNDYFGERLRGILERWTERLVKAAEEHGDGMLGAIEGVIRPSPAMRQDLGRFLDNTRKVLYEQFALARTRMDDRITEVRRELHRQIPAQIRANMRPVYRKAAAERGAGAGRRMVETLSRGAGEIADTMFRDVEQRTRDDIRNLGDHLARQYAEMAATVDRHASQAAENLHIGAVQLSLAEIERQRDALRRLGDVLRELEDGSIGALAAVGED
jgi:hypothetical protein